MAHIPHLITDLALITGAAALTTLIFKRLKQPLVLGYILAGLLVGPQFTLFPTIVEIESIRIWAEIGVIFLLFGLGLEFSFKKLVKVGGSSSITGLIEISAMLLIGYLTGQWLDWSPMDSLFLGGIIAISSTTIIIRAFEELGLKNRRFVSLVFGILIVEDLVAILLLVLLSTLAASQQFAGAELLISVLKLGFFLVAWFLVGIFAIPSFLRAIGKHLTDEMLLILSIGLCLVMVVIVTQAGFSAALGAFIMGSILSETIFVEKIEHLLQPVKDLFGAVFFVSVGMLINPQLLWQYAGPVALLSVIVIVGKSVNIFLGSLVAGQSLRHSIQTGLSMTQIGEFSFIIATLGLTLNVTSSFLYPIAVAVSAITTFTTPYMIRLAEPLCQLLERTLPTRWKSFLQNYSASMQKATQGGLWQQVLRTYLPLIVSNSVICIGVVLLASNYLSPLVSRQITASLWGQVLTALLALSVMAPFLWALAMRKIRTEAYNSLWKNRLLNRGPLVALEITRIVVGILLVFFLFNQLFSLTVGLAGGVLLIVIVLPLFSQRLQQTYARIEKLFLYNLHARQLTDGPPNGSPTNHASRQQLAAWDAHLSEFVVSADADGVGRPLAELAFREKYGVNIVQIERGSRVIVAPRGEMLLLPGDRLTVVGTDRQLQEFKPVVEPPPVTPSVLVPEIVLRPLLVDKQFPFLGMSIRASGIREQTHGVIVSIERGDKRMLNPDSSMVLTEGDIVWLSGERKLIRQLDQPVADEKTDAD